jgi:hypothetical protein
MKMIMLILISSLLILPSCAAARYDGPYNGKVIDADTAKPIDGVVIIGKWHKVYPGPAGAINEFYDAKETVTDKDGEFSISGMGLKVVSNLDVMNVTIFKAGYEQIDVGPWSSLKNDLLLRKKIKWEGNKAIIPLRKLTLAERKKRHADKETIPDKKQILFIKELNREYKEIGIPLYPEDFL